MRENAVRGKILEFLSYIYPEGADERTILSVFYQYHRSRDIDRALEYLSGKGYVGRKDIPHPYKQQEFVKLYKITSAGIDLMDGLTADAGVGAAPEKD